MHEQAAERRADPAEVGDVARPPRLRVSAYRVFHVPRSFGMFTAMGAALIVVLVAALLVAAVWPPPSAPEAWRRPTRRLRHLLRRRHYRYFG